MPSLPLHPPTPRSICSRLVPDHHPIRTNMKTHPAVSHTSRPEESPLSASFRDEHPLPHGMRRLGALPCSRRSQVGGRLAKGGGLSRCKWGHRSGGYTYHPFITDTSCPLLGHLLRDHPHHANTHPPPSLPLPASPHQVPSVLHPVQLLLPCLQARYKYASLSPDRKSVV